MAHEIISNFDNDSAENFLADMSTNGYGLITLSLERIIDNNTSPDLTECEEAVVACEIIAAVAGRPAHDLPDDLREWISMFLADGTSEKEEILNLKDTAADVIDFLVTESELRDLWEEGNRFEIWFETMVDLQKRLLD